MEFSLVIYLRILHKHISFDMGNNYVWYLIFCQTVGSHMCRDPERELKKKKNSMATTLKCKSKMN